MKLFIISLLLVIFGCDSSKNIAKDSNKHVEIPSETKVLNNALISQGYKVGTVKEVKSGDCTFIIVDEKTGAELDPVNFNEDMFKLMRKHDKKVYYKYTRSRMMNRCGNYQPVRITNCKAY